MNFDLHLRDLINSAGGYSRLDNIINVAEAMIKYWNSKSKFLLVNKDHPHYNFIVYEVYHDGSACAGRILNWLTLKESKDPNVWINKIYDNLIEMHFMIRAMNYILDKEFE